ncbi:MAG: outer membrane lipoprotein carrier protein LolA [Chitinophagaceae bacterium]
MQKLFILFLLIFSTHSGFSQDAKAKKILDDVSKKVKLLKTLKANFTITIAGPKTKAQSKKGTVYMKGDKYRVSISGQEIFCDTKNVHTYMKETNEVQISSFDPNENSFTPSKLFTNFYDKEYSYKFIGETKFNGKNVFVILLTPTNKAKQFSKIELMVDKASNIVAGGKLYEKNGNVYSYTINNYAANPAIQDAIFVFDSKKYPNVEVIDLR